MDSTTPKKPRFMPPVGDDNDHTSVTNAIAPPWDSAAEPSELSSDTSPGLDRTTQQTSAVSINYELSPGMKLGEYQLEQKLGQGGMGVVYAAVHPLIGKRAAIKILKKELCADPGQLERFVDEARVVNQIGHPNIVDVFAFGEMPDGRSYFVMELLEGETLRARIERSKLTLDEVRNIIKPLARALQAAHDKGVIHRDLKPDNVFLVDVPDEQPAAKLLDFGIAKLARNDHRVEKTATGAIVGTPQYIAPEQAKGYAIDPRADIYALGAILFELLTGRPPFVADNAMEMVAKHLMEAPVRPSTITRAITPELDDLVIRMLAKTADGRPSLGEVIAVIERSRTSAATVPFDRPTPPPVKSDPATPIPTAPISAPIAASHDKPSKPAFDAVPSSDTWVPARRPAWVVPAILAVPIVGLVAFMLVRDLGSRESGAPPPSPATQVIEEKTVKPAVVDKIDTPAAPSKASTPIEPAIEPETSPRSPIEPKDTTRPPLVRKEAPAKQDPVPAAKQDPVPAAKKAPVSVKKAPVSVKKDPVSVKKEPTPVKKDPPPVKNDPPKKDPPGKKNAPKKDPVPAKKDPPRDFTIPEGDGLASPGDFQKKN